MPASQIGRESPIRDMAVNCTPKGHNRFWSCVITVLSEKRLSGIAGQIKFRSSEVAVVIVSIQADMH